MSNTSSPIPPDNVCTDASINDGDNHVGTSSQAVGMKTDAIQSAVLNPLASQVDLSTAKGPTNTLKTVPSYTTYELASSTADLAQLERVIPPNTTVQQIPITLSQSSLGGLIPGYVTLNQAQLTSTMMRQTPVFITTSNGQLVQVQPQTTNMGDGFQSPAYQVVMNEQTPSGSHKAGTKQATVTTNTATTTTESVQMAAASTVMSPDSNTKHSITCKVCGDKASGYHYGVTSCEGCKGFFRRSIQKKIEYRCLRDGNCVVIRLNRNRCQFCRFKKCIAVGMSRDSVRVHGRVSKQPCAETEPAVPASEDKESYYLAIYDIILNISQAHHSNCAYTEDRVKGLAKTPLSLLPESHTNESVENKKIVMWQNLASHITASIQRVVEFAKRLPGFPDIFQDDQLILIKTGFFELWLIRIARTMSAAEGTVMFGDGSVVSKDQFELIFETDLVKAMFEFSTALNDLALNDTEIGLLSGIVLATSDRAGLQVHAEVEKIQDRIIEALKLQLSRNHNSEPALFANILMKLPELRRIGTVHNEKLEWFRQHWTHMKMPPLFAEIYDIPKNETSSPPSEEVQNKPDAATEEQS